MDEKILKIPYIAVREDWDLLQQFLKIKGNPKYIIVGNVNLGYRKDISDLGTLVGVEGNLGLYRSSIESLGDLEFVDGNSSLWFCQKIKTLGKLKKVGGYLNLNESSIESLGDLEYVGDDLNLELCQNIETLGKLKKVDKSLYMSKSSIESLGDLEYVGGRLYIRNTKIHYSELNKANVVDKIVI
jgi:small nuclear ribonucleoprotein (snRNP)-like protein